MALNANAIVTLADAKTFIRETTDVNDHDIERSVNSALLCAVSKTTLPLAMKVSTFEPPHVSNSRRRASILTVRPPTLMARRKAA